MMGLFGGFSGLKAIAPALQKDPNKEFERLKSLPGVTVTDRRAGTTVKNPRTLLTTQAPSSLLGSGLQRPTYR